MAAVFIKKLKDPDEDLDYTWDFDELLASGETIASYEFPDTPDDIELHDDAPSTSAVTAYVGPGGTAGAEHVVTCRITTNASPPRIFDRSIKFVLQTK